MLAAVSTAALAQLRHNYVFNTKSVGTHSNRHNINDGINRANLMEMHCILLHCMRLCLSIRNNIKNLQRQFLGCSTHIRSINNRNNLLQTAVLMVMMMLMRHMAVLMFMVVVMMMFMIVLMFMVMMMFIFVLMLVVIMMFVFVLMLVVMMMFMLMAMHYSIAVTMQKGHIMVMVSMLLVQNNIKITAVNACFRHSADFIFKALCRNTLQSLIQCLFVRAQVQKCCYQHIAADAGITFQI